ncbi:MAG: DUF5615 family PIN-like protein [Dehalococcoidia bacterium]|nr:hypothetical protein [Chloroflexi bacterium CFX7]MCK6565743.1 DUF5615 family PIN-like protein [Dehalococcoidia bacterium]NUQ54791.1 DUF5615 family PIN-like protein [Dehalococcoidia bacterium]
MRILADESVAGFIVERLRRDGHHVTFVAETMPGAPDQGVLSAALTESAVLLTADKDFGELVVRLGLETKGVVLTRLSGLPEAAQCNAVSVVFGNHGGELLGSFAVVAPGVVRIRPIGPGR